METAPRLADGSPVLDGYVVGFVSAGTVVFRDNVAAIKLPSAPKPYRASAEFAIGDTIVHPTFGEGRVVGKPDKGKILVWFADESRRVLVGR